MLNSFTDLPSKSYLFKLNLFAKNSKCWATIKQLVYFVIKHKSNMRKKIKLPFIYVKLRFVEILYFSFTFWKNPCRRIRTPKDWFGATISWNILNFSKMRENCPYKEFFLVQFFGYLDWIWKYRIYLNIYNTGYMLNSSQIRENMDKERDYGRVSILQLTHWFITSNCIASRRFEV